MKSFRPVSELAQPAQRRKQNKRAMSLLTVGGKIICKSSLQWSAVTVTPSGIGKSVTVTDCHS